MKRSSSTNRRLPAIALGIFLALFAFGALVAEAAQIPGQVTPCCGITSIDARTGIGTARENATGRTFQFKVTDTKLLANLRAGQGVYANFTTQQVSLDGKTACCNIASVAAAAPGAPAGVAPGQPILLPRRLNIAGVSGNTVTAGDSSGPKITFKPSSDITRNLIVGQNVWVEGNKATVVVFPIEMKKRKDLGGADKMETTVKVSNTGIIAGKTRTWTAEALRGFTGGVKVYIRDEQGNDLYITKLRRYGVNGTAMGGASERSETWEETMPAAAVGKVRQIGILHQRSPNPDRWEATVAQIKDVLEIAKSASEIYSTVSGADGPAGAPPGPAR